MSCGYFGQGAQRSESAGRGTKKKPARLSGRTAADRERHPANHKHHLGCPKKPAAPQRPHGAGLPGAFGLDALLTPGPSSPRATRAEVTKPPRRFSCFKSCAGSTNQPSVIPEQGGRTRCPPRGGRGLHRERHCSPGKLRTNNLTRSRAGEPQPSRGSAFGCAFARGVDTTTSWCPPAAVLALQSARGVRDMGGSGSETQPWRWRIALFLCHLSKEIAAG